MTRLKNLPPGLEDTELDDWWATVKNQGILTSATHGDYYRGNILCEGNEITGVIDWHDAKIQPTVLELAGATFELCKNDEHDLQVELANDFIASYRAAKGPVPAHEIQQLLPFIRLWVRYDAIGSLTFNAINTRTYDRDGADKYVQNQIRRYSLPGC